MSRVTRTIRFCAIMGLVCRYLDYIMHNDDMQAIRNHANLVRNPHLDLMYLVHNTRLDHKNDHCSMYSRDRNRRT